VRPSPAPVDMVTTGMIKRAEIRKQMRIAHQLKVGTLVLVAVLLLAAYPIYLFTRAASADPVFGDLDSLDLPEWATIQKEDAASGSRWCIEQCRFRERTWASERKPEETQPVYETALRDAGWRPRTDGVCPPVGEGAATCWQRDEYVMDMWIRAPVCDVPPPRPSIGPSAQATAPPAAEGTATAKQDGATPVLCPGSLVTVKVFNAIDYHPVG
jgi:hypothetical protein